MRIEDLKKSIDDYFQVSQSKKEGIRTLYEKAAENLSEPASMLFRLYDDLLEQAELLLKQCAEEALNIENLVEGLIKYAENNIEKNNHNSVIEAQGISQALAEKGANEYLPPGLLKKFEERREKIRKHPIPPLQHAYHEAQPAQTNQSPQSQSTEQIPPTQQQSPKEHKIPQPKGKNLLFKNEEEQKKWAELFIAFLKQHKRSNEELSTTAENYINRALFRFIFEWEKNNMLRKERNAQAPSVFLFASCKLKGVAFRGHANVIERLSKQCFQETDKNDDLHLHVAEFVSYHKTATINTIKD